MTVSTHCHSTLSCGCLACRHISAPWHEERRVSVAAVHDAWSRYLHIRVCPATCRLEEGTHLRCGVHSCYRRSISRGAPVRNVVKTVAVGSGQP